jgi:hypothetical protein
MSDNKLPNPSEQEGEIKVPTVSNVGAPISDKELTALQDGFLNKIAPKKSGEEKTQPAETPVKTAKPKSPKDSALAFSKKIKETIGATEGGEGEGDDPSDSADDGFKAPQVTEIYKLLEDPAASEESEEPGEEGEEEGEENSGPSRQSEEASKDSKTENIKNLRTSNAALKNKVAELERQLAQRGDTSALQTTVNNLKSRVKELEQYELVFGLHNNPQFRKEYIEGEKTLLSEMQAIATDYDVDPSIIEDILATESRRDEDYLVANTFPSDESRRDIKTLKRKIEALRKKRAEVEKAPKQSLEQLYSKEQETKAERDAKRDQHYRRVVNDAWTKAISLNRSLPEEQQVGELIEIPGMKKHNEKVVRPTLESANKLVSSGLAHVERMIRNQSIIDEPFAVWFANICQQAAATQMVHSTRKTLYERYQEVVAEKEKQRSFSRPGISTASRTTSVGGSKKKKDGKQIAADIFMEVQKDLRS